MSAIVHPELLAHLGRNFFRFRCTVQRRSKQQDSFGQPTANESDWNDTIVRRVPCALEAEAPSVKSGEMRMPELERRSQHHRITLQGHFPELDVDPSTDRAVVQDTKGRETAFNIVETISDSQATMTTLLVLRTKPGSEN